MDIVDYLRDAIDYTKSDIKNFVIGWILLSLTWFLISIAKYTASWEVYLILMIIFLIQCGYYIKIMKETLNGSNKLPDWNNCPKLLIDGLLYDIGALMLLFISLIPAFVGVVLYIAGLHFLVKTFSSIFEIIMDIGVWIAILGFIFGCLVFLIYLPISTANFANKGFFGFFEFKNLFKMMNLKYIVLAIVVYVLTSLVYFIVYLIIVFGIMIALYLIYGSFEMVYIKIGVEKDYLLIGLIAFISSVIFGVSTLILYILYHRIFANYYKNTIGKVRVWK
ncbi:hypothetical protein JH146_0556 [Methanocaldococcus bathoardescens]|uniref:DUF4013 domain-containing protein n=1 Tax=Methanocaldococcus bathoardescens TaxID=1301915 RepID=A0A076LAJ6_9EURY|nr:DUF4013 domain-containing protein [Methanocaldococcus bathoardescens]AIJ05405.1 hypothetical protein JH146_0556 [Methanocaldococcus bathoardescens]